MDIRKQIIPHSQPLKKIKKKKSLLPAPNPGRLRRVRVRDRASELRLLQTTRRESLANSLLRNPSRATTNE